MRRRSFFATAAAAALALLTGASCPARELRPVFRRTASGWERCRMFDLKVGDTMRIERHPTLDDAGIETVEGVVTSAPALVDGHWGVTVETAPSK